MNSKIILLFLFVPLTFFSQKNDKIDSTSFVSYRDKKILYTDVGFNTAPFSITFKDSLGNREHIVFRNNLRTILGLGFSYKWFSLRLAVNLPGHIKPVSKYGETKYLDLGFEFKTKRHFYEIDLHNYKGYALKNAFNWNDSLNEFINPHFIAKEMNALSLSVNTWRFFNKSINMSALKGKTAAYLKEEKSFYLKTTFNLHGISNNGSIIPDEKFNPKNSKTGATTISAFDFGILPGYVYVNSYKKWQYSGMLGLGPVIQTKFYYINGVQRGFLGLAPRVDFRFLLSYNVPKYFVSLITEFDNKSILFKNLRYQQTFYMIKLVGGIRF
ncbi:MAG: DUF4421 family protein [Bacteroidota bacterium]